MENKIEFPKMPKLASQKNSADEKNSVESNLQKLAEQEKKRKEEILKSKRAPIWMIILKFFAIILTTFEIIAFIFFSVELDAENKILQNFGIENTQKIWQKNFSREKKLKDENKIFREKIAKINGKIENQEYLLFENEIQKIRDGQIQWFDKTEEEMKIKRENQINYLSEYRKIFGAMPDAQMKYREMKELVNKKLDIEKNWKSEIEDPVDEEISRYGLYDVMTHMLEYFNSPEYRDPSMIVFGNEISIGKISLNRKNISFQVKAANIFGRVFFLSNEFIEIINSTPFFRGGKKIQNFTKQENENGDATISFSMNLQIQQKDEKDPEDARFSEYKNWLREKLEKIEK